MSPSSANPSPPLVAEAALLEIARDVGTPVYVYSASVIRDRYTALDRALHPVPHRVHYALKANSTLAVVRLIQALGGGADVNSGGELEVALRAGFAPADIVFTGVGKSGPELERAVSLGLGAINAESPGELERIHALAGARRVRARVALRVNPDIASGSHPHISTGLSSHKFGVPLARAHAVATRAAALDGIALVGLHVHIGSQMMTLDPIREAATAIVELAAQLAADGITLEHLDLGGGLGIAYDGATELSATAYAAAVTEVMAATGLTLVVEPGRWIVGPAGVLVATVVDVKPQSADRYFVVVDAGMSEFMRPALYGAVHRVERLDPSPGPSATCDIVGPICETSDVIAIGCTMPVPKVGDRLLVRDTGAYGAAMASNYNRRPLPAEVMVDEDRWTVVRRRQSVDDLVALER